MRRRMGGILLKGPGDGVSQDNSGRVTLTNSTIQNGEFGVRVGTDINNSGGILKVEDCTFRNCRVGISYYKYAYQQFPINGLVKNSTFYCDAAVPGHEGKGVLAHIGLYGIRGLDIQSCSFSNYMRQTDISDGKKGSGIEVWEGSINLAKSADVTCSTLGQPNHFEGLDNGIWLGGSTPRPDYASTLLDCNFLNNRTGINISQQSQPIIWNSYMQWDDEASFFLDESLQLCQGIVLDHTPGFEFTDSWMDFQTDNFHFEGLRVLESIDVDPSIIQNNHFTLDQDIIQQPQALPSNYVACIFDGNNSELFVNCNVYNNFLNDWEVHGQLHKQEGEAGLNLDPGNTFSNPCDNLILPTSPGFSFNSIYAAPMSSVEYVQYNLPPYPLCTEGVVNFLVGGANYPGCGTDYYVTGDFYCPGQSGGGEGGGEQPHLTNNQTNAFDQPIQVYPNPSSGSVIVSAKTNRVQLVQIFDMTGREVHSQNFEVPRSMVKLPLYHLKEGIYVIKVTTNNSSFEHKIILE